MSKSNIHITVKNITIWETPSGGHTSGKKRKRYFLEQKNNIHAFNINKIITTKKNQILELFTTTSAEDCLYLKTKTCF